VKYLTTSSAKIAVITSLFIGLLTQPLLALEVDRDVMPRMTLGGRIMSTVDLLELDSEPKPDGINLADSSLLLRFDKRTFIDGVAGAVLGLAENDEKLLRFHQLNTFYWNRNYRLELGRTRLRSTLLEFPLLRDDDLLDYTHVGNVSSNAEADQIYGEHASFDWFLNQKIQKLSAWAGTRNNGQDINAPNSLDSYGFGYVYQQPEDLRYVEWIRHAGVLVDRQKLRVTNDTEWLTAIVAGIEWNLNMHPAANWSAATQMIVNNGIDNTTQVDTIMARARTKSTTFVTSVRYTARPKLLTRWQAAITFAYKDYADVSAASQWSIVPSFVYLIGQGIDVFGQVKYTDYDTGLGGGSDTAIQIGMAFSLEAMFNDSIGERDSILNLEHGYIQ